MRQYNNILVIIEPKKDQQLALDRAIEVARFNPRVKVTALRLIYDFANDVPFLGKKSEMNSHQDVEEVTKKELESIITATLDRHAEAKARGVKIEPKIKWVRDISEGMVLEANSGHYDLLIKGANHHGIFDSIIFTPHDWNLLRHALIPVVIAKEHSWDPQNAIVVAVDFTSTEKQLMNILLLREAQLLATITKNPIHLVNSAPVVLPTIMLEVPNYAPELYAETVLAEHKRRIVEFAHHHNIPEANCHIAEGMPDDVIPKLCKKLNASTVFIGSQGRAGAAAALVGNTCEEIVDFINADLFVLNRKTVQHDVTTAHTQE